MEPLQSSVITDLEGIRTLEAPWRSLWEKSRDPSVFTGYDWARASAEAFAAVRSPRIVVVERGGEVVGILPVAVEGGTLLFLGMPESDSNDLICLPGIEAEAAACAIDALLDLPWRSATLDYLWEDSALFHALDKLPARFSRALHLAYRGIAPRAVLPPDDPATVAKIVKKKNELRLERQIGRKGQLSFRFLETPDELRAGFEHLVRLHTARRNEAGDQSVFLDARVLDFYDRLLARLDPRKDLRFLVMEFDGRTIACEFAFQHFGRLFGFKTAYDPEFRDYSPGTMIVRRTAQYAAENGLAVFDLSRGSDPYKLRFSNASKKYYALRVFHRGIVGWTERSLLRLKERVKQSPRLARLLRRLGVDVPAAPEAPVDPGREDDEPSASSPPAPTTV
jgi:CelD/BcsL family acetyltransferase involved in cellulose biosynthesis